MGAVVDVGAGAVRAWGDFDRGQYVGLVLIAVGTLVGAWLERRWSHRSTALLGAASGVLLAVAGADIVPHALEHAGEAGVPGWVVPVVAVATFVLLSAGRWTGRRGDRRGDPGRLACGGTAVALVLHRFVEGMTVVLLPSVAVVAALFVHSVSEGLALTALLEARGRRRLSPWLIAACVSPLVGGWVTEAVEVPEWVHVLLLALVAGVLLRGALTALTVAQRRQRTGELMGSPVLLALGSAVVVTATAVLVLR
ncbi:hypothetical protein [Streptomyces griseus]|uniref:hypothetical protein n=1 Tax=Streptomyces griseus TaxID=1911 RepID=UPI00068D22DE|nr:hypothetical protein [Streptomyces griseus]